MPTINAPLHPLHLRENSPTAHPQPLGSKPRKTAALAAAASAALLLCLVFSLATAPGAAAHDQLISTNPSQGQKLSEAPATLEFLFSGALMDIGTEVRVLDNQGKDWASGKPTASGEKVSQALAAEMPEGEYRASWRVVSSDGHPISGMLNFLVGDATAPGQPQEATESPSTAGPGAAEKPAASTAAAPNTPETANGSLPAAGAGATADAGGSGLPKALVVVLGAVAGLGAYVAFIVISRARKKS